jgi:hypothetical protein
MKKSEQRGRALKLVGVTLFFLAAFVIIQSFSTLIE